MSPPRAECACVCLVRTTYTCGCGEGWAAICTEAVGAGCGTLPFPALPGDDLPGVAPPSPPPSPPSPPSPPPPPPLSPFPPSLLTPLFPRPRPLLFPCCSAGGEFSRFKAFEPAAPVGTPYVYQFVPNQTFAIYPQVRACDTCVERAPPCIVLPSTLLPPAGCLHCMFMACAHACHEHLSSQDLLQSVNPPGPAVL